jgi:hypothetical protein
MGSIGDTARLAAFQNDIFPHGLDLNRCKIHQDGGVYRINTGASIRPGMLVSRNASGLIIPATGQDVFGVAKWGTVSIGNGVNVDEAHVVAYGAAVALRRGNVSNLIVRSAVDQGGSEIPALNNYTLSAVNGTLTWNNPPTGTAAPANAATVYVTYTYALTQADIDVNGVKFHSNTEDDVAKSSESRITVVTDWAILFTTEWDTGRTYTTTGTTSNLYCDANGRFSNNSAGGTGTFVGKVFQLPQNGDPFLGVIIGGGPVIAT